MEKKILKVTDGGRYLVVLVEVTDLGSKRRIPVRLTKDMIEEDLDSAIYRAFRKKDKPLAAEHGSERIKNKTEKQPEILKSQLVASIGVSSEVKEPKSKGKKVENSVIL